jgi:UDP:flavonoid glycosyltransferase YjiC (YdhE family)
VQGHPPNFEIAVNAHVKQRHASSFLGASLDGPPVARPADGVSEPPPAMSIEVVPPILREPDALSLSVRGVSSHGSALLPLAMSAPAPGKRIVISFGTVLGPAARDAHIAALSPVLAASDAEFLLPSTDDADPGDVPANVRLLPWAPLIELLRHSDGIIHHGGAGTFMSAVVAGVPQLIVPHAADQYLNARVAERHGFGRHVESIEDVDSAAIAHLLTDDGLRAAAARIQAENDRQPPPSALVAPLEEWSRRQAVLGKSQGPELYCPAGQVGLVAHAELRPDGSRFARMFRIRNRLGLSPREFRGRATPHW